MLALRAIPEDIHPSTRVAGCPLRSASLAIIPGYIT
jgi:hypothetical protein